MALEFECEQACLAMRDEELERLVRLEDSARTIARSAGRKRCRCPRSDAFLIDSLEISLCWAFQRQRARRRIWLGPAHGPAFSQSVPAPPDATREEFAARGRCWRSTIEAGGRPTGPRAAGQSRRRAKRFLGPGVTLRASFEQIVRHIGPPLENIFLMRHFRARAVESERSRISRDLHDGILQTLLSLNIQLDVLRRKFPWTPEQAGKELETAKNRPAGKPGIAADGDGHAAAARGKRGYARTDAGICGAFPQ